MWGRPNKYNTPHNPFSLPKTTTKPRNAGTSFLNRAEASGAERVVTHLLKAGVIPAQIGVITPYQVRGICLGLSSGVLGGMYAMETRRSTHPPTQSHTDPIRPTTFFDVPPLPPPSPPNPTQPPTQGQRTYLQQHMLRAGALRQGLYKVCACYLYVHTYIDSCDERGTVTDSIHHHPVPQQPLNHTNTTA